MHPLNVTGISRILLSAILGLIFGLMLTQSKLSDRKTLIDQFEFKSSHFAITFLVSIIIGVPLFYFLTKYHFIYLRLDNYRFWGIFFGAIITGMGLYLCGHIPITALVSIGNGKIYSLWAFIGMLLAFPLMKLFKPIVNDYVFSRPSPADINMLAKDTIIYSGKSTMLYLLPITCLILALFLRLISKNSDR